MWRAKRFAEIPDDLFERLIEAGITSTRALADIAAAAKSGNVIGEIERCHHCGGVLRIRERVGDAARAAIRAWLTEGVSQVGAVALTVFPDVHAKTLRAASMGLDEMAWHTRVTTAAGKGAIAALEARDVRQCPHGQGIAAATTAT